MQRITATIFAFLMLLSSQAYAHFGMVIPSDEMVTQGESSNVKLDLMFIHPFEMVGMPLEKPEKFGVIARGQQSDLLGQLKQTKILGHEAWQTSYKIKRPGVYAFYMQPKPYWEPAEDCYIVHYTKTVISAFGLEDGWDEPLGLKTEIVPLSRPYGLYAGNVFQGQVLLDGKPVAGCEVEIEHYNQDGSKKPANEYMVTQVVKTDPNGIFTYGVPEKGWWGFAALNTSDTQYKGKDVELGAVLWVNFLEMD